jgi:hypothetical protein
MANWLETGLCTYDGPEADLPLGGYSKIPGWYPEKVALRWTVMDAENEETGTAEKKTKELTSDDIILGVTLNTKTLAAIEKTYGSNFYLVKAANAGPWLTPEQWFSAHEGTNGLGLVAIRNMRRKLSGGGIKF